METIEIEISSREGIGSSNSRRLRKSGQLPAVVYQPGSESLSVTLDRHSFVMSARGKPHTQIFKFKGNTSLAGKLSLVKGVQFEPIKGEVVHVEFLAVAEDHKVVVNVQVTITGIPECVKLGEATVNQVSYEVAIECFPTSIPEILTLDISKLEAGESMHASNVILPENCALKSPAGLTIVTAFVEKKGKEAEPVAAAAVATPAAAAKPAPGAKAPAGKK